jgi:RHS repeat-associated protein
MRATTNRTSGMKTMFKKITRFVAFLVLALPLLHEARADTVTYYHNDLLGSPVAATNQAGQVIWRESYRPYGERLVKNAQAQDNSVWYTSKLQDPDTGLVYLGARYYDPVIGRFLSTDPVGFDEKNIHSFNRYAYANNNPYKFVDPDGRHPVVIAMLVNFGGGSVIGGGVAAGINAAHQLSNTGDVRWGGIGGVADALGDGMVLGGMLGIFGAEYGGAAAGLALVGRGEAAAAAKSIAPQIAKIEKQLAQHGRESVEKSLRSLENRIAEHRKDLDAYRAQGGYTSSVEREIRAFETEVQAIKDVLGEAYELKSEFADAGSETCAHGASVAHSFGKPI